MNAPLQVRRGRVTVDDRPSAAAHPTSTSRKLAPVVLQPYDGPGRRKLRPQPGRSKVSATYASIEATCPTSCAFRERGCYVREGFTRAMSDQLDANAIARGLDGTDVMLEEVRAIKRLFGGGPVPHDGGRKGEAPRDLRLHVGGDVSGRLGAELLAIAAADWRERGGGDVWTYTHRWARIARDRWGSISVLASVESAGDAARAHRRGYVPAIVVERFPRERRVFSLPGLPLRFVPCPAEVGRMTCVECRLCLDDGALHERGLGIAFEAHGRHVETVRRRLPVLGGPA